MATDFRDAAGRFASSRFEGDKLLDAVSATVLRYAKQEAPRARDTQERRGGQLAESLHIEGTGDERHITSDVPYLGFVLRGTPAHYIAPRVKKALYWPGARHPVNKPIWHPGTDPNLFFDRALDAGSQEVQRALANVGDEFLAGLIPR